MNAAALLQSTVEDIPPQGLPYWTLWLLLCVILLLLTFIFLRDKDLRHRLDFFLSGAKRRMLRTRLQMRLNKAKRRRSSLMFELGRLCWSARLAIPKTAALLAEIDRWEEQRLDRQSGLKASLGRILELQHQLEESRSRTRHGIKLKDAEPKPDPKEAHEQKERERHIRKEIRAIDRKIRGDQEAVKRLDLEKRVRLEALGSLADEARPPQPDLQELFTQIDAVNRSILHYMAEIENLF